METGAAVWQRYQAVVDDFVEKVSADRNVIAIYLYGSMVRGDLWDGSDVDLFVVTKHENDPAQIVYMMEDGIFMHTGVMSRSGFRRMHESILRGSADHSVQVLDKPLYERDDSLREYREQIRQVGARDLELLEMLYATATLNFLNRAEKALRIDQDATLSFLWLMRAVEVLAELEVALNGGIVEREMIKQAVAYNPTVFDRLYTQLIHGEKTPPRMREALDLAETYLLERTTTIFKPLLDYLAQDGVPKGIDALTTHFNKKFPPGYRQPWVIACAWLAEQDIILQTTEPVQLTTKSRVRVDEVAYFYDKGNHHEKND